MYEIMHHYLERMISAMYEIVFHGRAGQGAKSASHIVAEAAMQLGKYIQAFPEYGAAREGAPMRVFLRIADAPIRLNTAIVHPDMIVVLDYSLVGLETIYDGIKDNTTILLNAKTAPVFLKSLLLKKNPSYTGRIYWLDASTLSFQEVGRNVTNTAMLGVFCAASSIVQFETLKQVFRNEFEQKLSQDVLYKNMQLLDKAYHQAQVL
ncbi:MAG: 2-oxoacid:acceptor oxidoreductase family protein [Candidatus Woesearchaeota archaeon]